METVQDKERGDTGGTGLPDYFLHCGGLSGKGGSDGSLRASEIISNFWLGGSLIQHHFLCGRKTQIRAQPHMGPYNTDSGGKDALGGGTNNKSW